PLVHALELGQDHLGRQVVDEGVAGADRPLRVAGRRVPGVDVHADFHAVLAGDLQQDVPGLGVVQHRLVRVVGRGHAVAGAQVLELRQVADVVHGQVAGGPAGVPVP